MFSQNVFSARDVQLSSSFNVNGNESQQHSQTTYSSQNSQTSSKDLYSLQKQASSFEQYQKILRQTRDESPNYFSKYASNRPILLNSSTSDEISNHSTKSIQDEKQNIFVKEERDLLQTFINLLKEYSTEVNLSLKHFKENVEETLQSIINTREKGTEDINDRFESMKKELMAILALKNKELKEKDELNNCINEKSEKIRLFEAKIESLQKQLDDLMKKESAYIDQKKKLKEMEEKYYHYLDESSYLLRNTPPLSQSMDPMLAIPPFLQNKNSYMNSVKDSKPMAQKTFPSSSYTTWQGIDNLCPFIPEQDTVPIIPNQYNNTFSQENEQRMTLNNVNPILQSLIKSYQPTSTAEYNQIDNSWVPPLLYSSKQETPTKPLPSFPTTSSKAITPLMLPTYECQEQKSVNLASYAERNIYGKKCNKDSPSTLNVHRKNRKKPLQSPMALVKPMIQSGSKSYEDEIFIGDGVYKKEAGNKSSFHSDDNQQIIIKPLVKQESIKIISNLGADAKNKLCSKETIMRRKRNSLSMLGKSPGEDQLQKISNSIQGRVSFSKRAKCFPK